MVDLNRTLREKDDEIHSLEESVTRLERTNQQLKDEQESLKTVNQLSLEDMNKLNSDLQLEVCTTHCVDIIIIIIIVIIIIIIIITLFKCQCI